MDAEKRRLIEAARHDLHWRRWGPYLSEREWGTVREDYSAKGTAWEYFPHDHARSRAYRWGEDGIGGLCDRHPRPLDPPRSHPQGATLRLEWQRRQPRRRREGVLLLSRRHADPLLPEDALQIPAGGISLRAPGRGKSPENQGGPGV